MKGIAHRLLKLSLWVGIVSFGVAASAQCKFTTLTIPGSTADTATGVAVACSDSERVIAMAKRAVTRHPSHAIIFRSLPSRFHGNSS